MEGPGSAVAAVLATVLLGALFAAIDAGLAELGEVRLRATADAGGPHASTARRVLRDLERIHARLLAGRVVSITTAAALASFLAAPLGGLAGAIGAAFCVALAYGILVAIAGRAARQLSGRFTLWALRWLRPLELAMMPLSAPLEWLGDATERVVRETPTDDAERVTELGLSEMIKQARESGSIGAEHAELLRSALEFKDTLAHEVMVPRTQMVAIEIDRPLPEILELIVEVGHSRYPVFRDRVDQVIGILYAKDLLGLLGRGKRVEDVELAQVIRTPPFFVAEQQRIGTLLKEMQAKRVHLAVVVDEFGGTSGIVTLEDILEELVGEIRDEYDREDTAVTELGTGRWLVDAGISVYDLEEQIGERIQLEEGEYDSIGGMIIELAGHVPAVGESVESEGFELTVREADHRRVRRVELSRRTRELVAE